LLDPELPGIGGLTVVGYFKRDAKTRHIAIIRDFGVRRTLPSWAGNGGCDG
jgi:hypothetical protein